MDKVDDSYFMALADDDDDLFPISDEKYAGEMQLQEVLVSSAIAAFDRYGPPTERIKTGQCEPLPAKEIKKEPAAESSSSSSSVKIKEEKNVDE